MNALSHLSTRKAETIKRSYKLTLLGKRLTQGSCGPLIGRMRKSFVGVLFLNRFFALTQKDLDIKFSCFTFD